MTKRLFGMMPVLAAFCLMQGCPSDGPPGAPMDQTSSVDGLSQEDGSFLDAVTGDRSNSSDAEEDLGESLDSMGELGNFDSVDLLDPLESFFSLESVHSIEIAVDEAGLEALIAEPKVYVRGSVKVDDVLYEEVGVRLKGGLGSFVPIDEEVAYGRLPAKSGFIIDFNRYIKGQDHHGLKKLTLNNMVQDRSGMHQFLGYALFREEGIPASRSGFGVVTFNGTSKGLYALIEPPDNKEFMKRWFGADHGNLYEGDGSDLTLDAYAKFDQDRGDDTSKEDLRVLSEALDAMPVGDEAYDVLANLIDLDEYLTFTATEIFLSHWDGYAWNTNNYMIYHDLDEDRFLFLPWGTDQLFDEQGIIGPYHGLMKSLGPSWETPERGFDSLLHGGRLHHICYSSPTCKAHLAVAFRQVIQRAGDMGLAELAVETRQLIEPLMVSEATEYGDLDVTLQAMDQVSAFLANREEDLEQWLPCLDGLVVDSDGDSFDGCVADCDDNAFEVHPGAPELCNISDDDCDGILDNNQECPECYNLPLPSGSYSLCFHPLPWAEARQHCIDRGQELASIHDEQTNGYLAWNLLQTTGYAESWIGLNDVDVEGTFVWTDGSPVDFDYRLFNMSTEWDDYLDCVAFTVILGWLPMVCWDARAFLCKSP